MPHINAIVLLCALHRSECACPFKSCALKSYTVISNQNSKYNTFYKNKFKILKNARPLAKLSSKSESNVGAVGCL